LLAEGEGGDSQDKIILQLKDTARVNAADPPQTADLYLYGFNLPSPNNNSY
jgi:hypothetical protein